jgi:hypothetical protein
LLAFRLYDNRRRSTSAITSAGGCHVASAAAKQGRGLRDITRELNRLNIRTPQGMQWYASTVRNQLGYS